MEEPVQISIAKEYSVYPAGRDDIDGPFNGTRFRQTLLLPKFIEACQKSVPLVVSLDGVMSFGSSFLEEAFGGLVRLDGVNKKQLKKTLRIDPGWAGNTRYKDAIEKYIEAA